MKVSKSDQYESITDCNAIFELVFISPPIEGDPKEKLLISGQWLPSMLKSSVVSVHTKSKIQHRRRQYIRGKIYMYISPLHKSVSLLKNSCELHRFRITVRHRGWKIYYLF